MADIARMQMEEEQEPLDLGPTDVGEDIRRFAETVPIQAPPPPVPQPITISPKQDELSTARAAVEAIQSQMRDSPSIKLARHRRAIDRIERERARQTVITQNRGDKHSSSTVNRARLRIAELQRELEVERKQIDKYEDTKGQSLKQRHAQATRGLRLAKQNLQQRKTIASAEEKTEMESNIKAVKRNVERIEKQRTEHLVKRKAALDKPDEYESNRLARKKKKVFDLEKEVLEEQQAAAKKEQEKQDAAKLAKGMTEQRKKRQTKEARQVRTERDKQRANIEQARVVQEQKQKERQHRAEMAAAKQSALKQRMEHEQIRLKTNAKIRMEAAPTKSDRKRIQKEANEKQADLQELEATIAHDIDEKQRTDDRSAELQNDLDEKTETLAQIKATRQRQEGAKIEREMQRAVGVYGQLDQEIKDEIDRAHEDERELLKLELVALTQMRDRRFGLYGDVAQIPIDALRTKLDKVQKSQTKARRLHRDTVDKLVDYRENTHVYTEGDKAAFDDYVGLLRGRQGRMTAEENKKLVKLLHSRYEGQDRLPQYDKVGDKTWSQHGIQRLERLNYDMQQDRFEDKSNKRVVDDLFPESIKQNQTFDNDVHTINREIKRASNEAEKQDKRVTRYRDRYDAKSEMKVGRYMLPNRKGLRRHAHRLKARTKPPTKPKKPEPKPLAKPDSPKAKRHKKEPPAKPPAKPATKPKPDLPTPAAKRHKTETAKELLQERKAIKAPPQEKEKQKGTKRKLVENYEFDIGQMVFSPDFDGALVVRSRQVVAGVNRYTVELPEGNIAVMSEGTLSKTKKPKKAKKTGVKVANPFAKKPRNPKATKAAQARHRARTKSPKKTKSKRAARARTRSPAKAKKTRRDDSPQRKTGKGGYVFNPFY